MKYRNFNINVDGDTFLYRSVLFDETTGVPNEPLESTMFGAMSLNPQVIDISNLNYRPRVGDTWNGTEFIGDDGSVSQSLPPEVSEDVVTFSFCVDNKHSFYSALVVHPVNDPFIAALKSNPTITFEDVDA